MKNNKLKSLRTEFLGMFVIAIVAALFFGLTSFYLVDYLYTSGRQKTFIKEKEQAAAEMNRIAGVMENMTMEEIAAEGNDIIGEKLKYDITILNSSGDTIFTTSRDSVLNMNYIVYRQVSIKDGINVLFVEGKRYTSYEEDIVAIIILLIATILVVFIFFNLANRRIDYIHEISTEVEKIAAGDMTGKVKMSGNDELTALANNINTMRKALIDRKEREKKIEKSKKELITNMSHDLRTPLTSILGYLNLLKEEKYKDESERREYTLIAYSKAEQLKELINRLFQYSKLSSEKIKLEKKELDVNMLLTQLKGEYSRLLDKSGLEFIIHADKGNPKILADPLLLVRLFENLIMNAVKYAERPGSFTIRTLYKKDTIQVKISNKVVQNKLKKEDMKNLFERTFIADKSRTGGNRSGLGLAISREIVEMHGGTISAELKRGNIIFTIELRRIG